MNRVNASANSENPAQIATTDAEFNAWSLLHQTVDVISRAREKEVSRYGIALRQVAALHVINLLGDRATPTQLAQWLFRKPHTISSILDRMEKEGLIVKRKDLERKNLIRVSLTAKGREAHHHSMKRESIHDIMSCLSAAEIAQLRSYMDRLRDRALKELDISQKPPFPPSDQDE